MINALYVMNTYRLKAFFLQPRKSLDFNSTKSVQLLCVLFLEPLDDQSNLDFIAMFSSLWMQVFKSFPVVIYIMFYTVSIISLHWLAAYFLHSGCRADASEAAIILLPSNITVFTLDFSGSGLSGGEHVTLGWNEVSG